MKTSGYIIISLLLLLSIPTLGQDKVDVDQDLIPDTLRGKFIPTGLRIGVDLINIGQSLIKNGLPAITQGEIRELQFSADVDFYRYFFNVEYGRYEREWNADNAFYHSKGSYYKMGPDVNFLHRDPDGSALFFGLRYAFNKFSDNIDYGYIDPFWGDGSTTDSNSNLKAHWFELTTGLKVKITRIIWLGYTARFKFAASGFEDEMLIPHWMPGFGLTEDTSAWGLDYWLIIKIPFKKEKVSGANP